MSVTPASSSSALWTVNTPRGSLQTRTLVVASNAYTSGFLPLFKDKIVPVRGTACSITPPASHTVGRAPGPFRMSYGLRHGKGQSDYLIPRQGRGRIPGKGDQSFILGGAKGLFQHDEKVWYNCTNDDEQIAGAREYFQAYGRKHFTGWSGDGSEVDHVWTGSTSCRRLLEEALLTDCLVLSPRLLERPAALRRRIAFTKGHLHSRRLHRAWSVPSWSCFPPPQTLKPTSESSDRSGMPRIPACALSIANLAHAHTRSSASAPSTPSAALTAFQQAIPAPYWVTEARLASTTNLIKGMMGSKGSGEGRVAVEEPADLKGAKVLAKL